MEIEKSVILEIHKDGTAYAKYGSRPVDKTISPDDYTHIDLDSKGYIVGVEYNDPKDLRRNLFFNRDLPF